MRSVDERASGDLTDRRPVLVGLMLTMGLAAVDTTIVATVVPSIIRDLGGFSLIAWVFSVYVLAQAVMIPVYGKLADLYGRKPVLILGTLLFLVGSVLSGLTWNMIALIAFRGVQGLGAGAIQATVMTVAGDLYTLKERGRVQGWLSSVWGVAAVVGPAVGGLLAQYATWRWIFYINVPIGLAAVWVINRHLHERVVRRRHQIDVLGALLLLAGVGLLILGLLAAGVDWPWLSGPGIGVFAAAAVALAVFAWHERRVAEPMVPPWVFGRRLLVGANLAAGAIGLLTIGLTTFLPTYTQSVQGAGPITAGFVLAVMSISWPLASALSARLYLRIGFRHTALVGALLCALAGVVLLVLPVHVSPWTSAAGTLVMGAGLGLISTPIVVGLQSVVGWEQRGTITGANMFTRQLGQAVGAAVFGSIANATLVGYLAGAPARLTGRLPSTIDEASKALAGGTHGHPEIAAYIRQGLSVATHHIFIGLIAVAAGAALALLFTPRRFQPLFGTPPTPSQGVTQP